jgi:beta-glucosidase
MKSRHPHFRQPDAASERRITRILARLTLDEKITLLGGEHKGTIALEKKGIPKIYFADGPIGVHWWCEAATAYPALIALAASWDVALAGQMGRALGRDCRARGVHVLLAPGVNLYRSPLCGRNFEYLGEDPWLTSRLAVAYIRSLQDQGVAATVKHYALNFQEYDRHDVSSDANERTLREVYLAAFEAAVREAGVAAVMTGYNLVNGQHCSENGWLIDQVLRRDWGFDGLVMSDWASTYCAAGAAHAGLDLEMPTGRFLNCEKLQPLLDTGVVSEACLDEKVRRLLRLAVCFGWLDHPRQDTAIPLDDPATAAVALEIARRGTVLLKNSRRFLPLDTRRIRRLAVIGHHAVQPVISGGGSAYTQPFRATSILDGLRTLAPDSVEIVHAAGLNPFRHKDTFANSAFLTPDGRPGLHGEYFGNQHLTGEPVAVRTDANLSFLWHDDTPPAPGVGRWNFSVRWRALVVPETDGDHVFYLKSNDGFCRVLVDGQPVIDTATSVNRNGGLNRGLVALRSGHRHELVAEFRQEKGWNSFQLGYEHADAWRQDLAPALALARGADAVVLATGFNADTESEGFDRPFGLDLAEETLVREVCAANPKTALVLYAGGGVDLAPWLGQVRALLQAWYPGQEGGTAIAEILLGQVNPSGRLPFTIERRLADRSSHDCYHDADGDRRVLLADGVFTGHRHFDRHNIKPLFPFGFGLGYTTFGYGKMSLSATRIPCNGTVTVSCEVANLGDRPGTETVQLYVQPPRCPHPRPVKELKGFAQANILPGKRKTVRIKLNAKDLRYFDPDRRDWAVVPGRYRLLLGTNAADIRLQASLDVTG